MACCGDVPTLECLAAVSLLREHLPKINLRVVNVVDLMKLESHTQHPHGLTGKEFDQLFTLDKPVIFAFHGYPSLIHQLTYRRNNHKNMHVHGYKEEGTISTYFDNTVLNELDRFHLALDAVARLPASVEGIEMERFLRKKLIDHTQYIQTHGKDMPEIVHWKWQDIQS